MNKLPYQEEVFSKLDFEKIVERVSAVDCHWLIPKEQEKYMIYVDGKLFKTYNNRSIFFSKQSAMMSLKTGNFGSVILFNIEKYFKENNISYTSKEVRAYFNKYINGLIEDGRILIKLI